MPDRSLEAALAVTRLGLGADIRALFKGVLLEHLGMDRRTLDATVFPDSASVRPLTGIVA